MRNLITVLIIFWTCTHSMAMAYIAYWNRYNNLIAVDSTEYYFNSSNPLMQEILVKENIVLISLTNKVVAKSGDVLPYNWMSTEERLSNQFEDTSTHKYWSSDSALYASGFCRIRDSFYDGDWYVYELKNGAVHMGCEKHVQNHFLVGDFKIDLFGYTLFKHFDNGVASGKAEYRFDGRRIWEEWYGPGGCCTKTIHYDQFGTIIYYSDQELGITLNFSEDGILTSIRQGISRKEFGRFIVFKDEKSNEIEVIENYGPR